MRESLISLGQNPFSDFLAFTGGNISESFFRRNSGILNLDKEGQNLAEYLLDGAAKELHEKSRDSGI